MDLKKLFGGLLTVLILAGCGTVSVAKPQGLSVAAPSTIEAEGRKRGIPTNFTTIMVQVVKLLPDDSHGLPHQKFVVRQLKPETGMIMEVAHDTKYAPPVDDLRPGDKLVIRGVEWHDQRSDGIHWTHHASKPGDAGFIQTEDGRIYQ